MRQMVSFITDFRSIFHVLSCLLIIIKSPFFPLDALANCKTFKSIFFVIDLIHQCLAKELYTALDRIE